MKPSRLKNHTWVVGMALVGSACVPSVHGPYYCEGDEDCTPLGLMCRAHECVAGIVDRGDGTLADSRTSLMWAKAFVEGDWDACRAACGDSALAGYGDWRLPTIDELRTLVVGCAAIEPGGACAAREGCENESQCFNAACESCQGGQGTGANGCYMDGPFDRPCEWNWSETVVPWEDGGRYKLGFYDGQIHVGERSSAYGTHCVRTVR